ncbi:MAG: hypothetical protein V1837_01185 [Candidatus Woesearchaeota archaeon]
MEVAILKLSNHKDHYKLTKTASGLRIHETKVFQSLEEAQQQIKELLNV